MVMSCEEARVALLEAEPDELDVAHDGALAQHLRACASCRAQAARIMSGTSALRTALDHAVAARAGDFAAPRGGDPAGMRAGRRRRWRWLGVRALAPLAAAAALATILLIDFDSVIRRFANEAAIGFHVPEERVPTAPAVNVARVNAGAGSGVAVMRTTNPHITVVWTF
jgi:hypothetical protein